MADDSGIIALDVPILRPCFTNTQRAEFKRRYQAENVLPKEYATWDSFWNNVRVFQQPPRAAGKPYDWGYTTVVATEDHQRLVRWWMGCFVGLEKNRKKQWWKIF